MLYDVNYYTFWLHVNYASSLMSSICLGIYVSMVYTIIRSIIARRKRHQRSKGHNVLLIYTLSMFFATVGWYTSAAIYNARFLASFETVEDYLRKDTAKSNPALAAPRDFFKVVQTLGADAILIWRVHVICDNFLPAGIVLCILWLASLAIGIVTSLYYWIPSLSPVEDSEMLIAFACLSISLNILATAFITVKLLRQRRYMSAAGISSSGSGSNSSYTFVSAVFVESAAVYTIFGIIYLPFQALDSPLKDCFSVLFRMMSCIGPALIQLRLAQNSAYTRSAPKIQTPIVFVPQSQIERSVSFPMATIPDPHTLSVDTTKHDVNVA